MQEPGQVRCVQCGNQWETRYPLEEYQMYGGDRRLKCPSCNQGRKNGFKLVDDEDEEPVEETTISIVEQAELERMKHAVRRRIDVQFESIVGKPPAAYEKTDSDEYRWTEGVNTLEFWCDTDAEFDVAYELLELWHNLDETTATEELEPVNDRLDEFAERLEQVTERKTTIERLDDEIAERKEILEEKRKKLDDLTAEFSSIREQVEAFEDDKGMELAEMQAFANEHRDLIVDVDELRIERERLEVQVGDFESRDEAYKCGHMDGWTEGYEEAKSTYRITYPCAVCGEELTITYGSDAHKQAGEYLRSQNWGHTACHQQAKGTTFRSV